MRIEHQDRWPKTGVTSHLQSRSQQAAMGLVYTVEIADGQGAWLESRGLVQAARDDHADASTSICNPSYASRTCGGRVASVRSCCRSWHMWVKNARFGCSSSTSST